MGADLLFYVLEKPVSGSIKLAKSHIIYSKICCHISLHSKKWLTISHAPPEKPVAWFHLLARKQGWVNYRFVINTHHLKASEVAALYKKRWQIQIFLLKDHDPSRKSLVSSWYGNLSVP